MVAVIEQVPAVRTVSTPVAEAIEQTDVVDEANEIEPLPEPPDSATVLLLPSA